MDITKTFNTFDFSKISLANPIRMQGGSYYSKILLNNAQTFFVQTPKCVTKNGIVETGKRIYTDLLLQPEQSEFIQFILDVETQIKKILQEKNNEWFENSMDDDDIDYFFNTNLKTYKQQNYLFRAFITNSRTLTSLHNIQIYDDNEEEKSFDDVKEKNIISIFHFKGVKFTSSSFHIDVELKQVMIMNDVPIFSKRLITTPHLEKQSIKNEDNVNNTTEIIDETTNETNTLEANTIVTSDNLEQNEVHLETTNDDNVNNINMVNDIVNDFVNEAMNDANLENSIPVNDISENNIDNNSTNDNSVGDDSTVNYSVNSDSIDNDVESENLNANIEIPDTEVQSQTNLAKPSLLDASIQSVNIDDELQEFTLDINDSDPITLKKPNEVYYEIYKRAKQKARDAKKQAIIAYLEAKHIKKTYMLEDLDDSSSDEDFDEDFDEESDEDSDKISEMSYEDLE